MRESNTSTTQENDSFIIDIILNTRVKDAHTTHKTASMRESNTSTTQENDSFIIIIDIILSTRVKDAHTTHKQNTGTYKIVVLVGIFVGI